MLEIRIKDTLFQVGFSFFAVLSLFFFFDNGTGILALCAAVCHELGHLIIITAVGIPLRCVTLYGAGIRISADISQLPRKEKAAVLAAGCAMNFALCIASYFAEGKLFSAVNLVMGFFNLLPFGELDGAQLLRLWLTKHCSPQNAERCMKLICIAAAAAVAAILLKLNGKVGLTFVITCCYLILLMSRRE